MHGSEERDSKQRAVLGAAARSNAVSEFDELGQREKPDAFQAQFVFFAEVFSEMFNLLEEHAPLWYTEQHHSRAVAALRVLQESQAEAAPSQEAGK